MDRASFPPKQEAIRDHAAGAHGLFGDGLDRHIFVAVFREKRHRRFQKDFSHGVLLRSSETQLTDRSISNGQILFPIDPNVNEFSE